MKLSVRLCILLWVLLGGVWVVTWGAEDFAWGNVNIGGGGFVSAVMASPIEENLFYARTDVGGAYRWIDSAQSWVSLLDWVNSDERGYLGVEAMAVDPQTPGKLYMMTGTVYWNQASDGIGRSAFMRSVDYGKTWEVIPTWNDSRKWFAIHGNGMGRGTGEALAVDPANSDILFFGSRNKGLWKSTNNGDSWSKVESFPVDTTWNGAGVSFVAFDPASANGESTQRIIVGVLRAEDNVLISEDAGATWSVLTGRPAEEYAPDLMPQRIALKNDGQGFYMTFGNGAGPHTQQWDEGWGMIDDWYNRGAVYSYNFADNSWTDISPQNLIDPENDGDASDPSTYYGAYSGLSVDPENPDFLVVSSTASYRGTQYWMIDGDWQDKWGDNIFVSEDGGQTWVPSFKYYWIDGGVEPVALMDENGFPWIVGNTIHWISSVAVDPNNPSRVFVTSGNGIYRNDNILDYTIESDGSVSQRAVWKFSAAGVEEVVPTEVVSVPGGPLVSVILDYDGFVHSDITEPAPLGNHKTEVGGNRVNMGSTTDLAFAPQSGLLAKVTKTRSVELQYNSVPVLPVQYSADTGKTWTVTSYSADIPEGLSEGSVALSADGSVTIYIPGNGESAWRGVNSSWTQVSGVDFFGDPVGDPVDSDVFYLYNRYDGMMYVSDDAGVSFNAAGNPGVSNFRKARVVPGVSGDVWVPVGTVAEDGSRSGALMRSTDGGQTFNAVGNVGYCEAVGFGAPEQTGGFPAVYVFAEIDGVTGVFQSVDEGDTWVRINDDAHEYGGLANGEFVTGDMNTFGVVYMSTAGRGIAARMPAEWVQNPSQSEGSTSIEYAQPETISNAVTVRVSGNELTYSADLNNSILTVMRIDGTSVLSQALHSNEGQGSVDLKNLHVEKGVYILRIQRQGKMLWSGTWVGTDRE